MKLQTIIHATENTKPVVERLVNENLDKKLNTYLKQFEKEDVEWIIDFSIDENKKWLFNWALQIKIDWKSFRYEREDYKNLDDLVNNLFDHFKEELAKK